VKKFKIFLIGSSGQVGKSILSEIPDENIEFFACTRTDWDMGKNPSHGLKLLLDYQPNLVINASAYTQVDDAEDNFDLANNINNVSPKLIAEFCLREGIPFLHISTDYVFDGKKTGSYNENDKTCPINSYGITKARGDAAIVRSKCKYIIVRTSWVFSKYGKNFVKTILSAHKNKQKLRIIDDQYGGPTSARCIALALKTIIHKIIEKKIQWGIYNFSGEPYTTWFEFASKIVEKYTNFKKIKNDFSNLETIKTQEANFYKAKRPLNSCLDNYKIFNQFKITPCDWQTELDSLIKDEDFE